MLLNRVIRFVARGAIALPLFAFGHGTEMLDARFEFDSNGALLLQVTSDYSGNPMLADEAEARAALQDALRIEFEGSTHKLSELAPMKLELRDQPDPDSPMPRAPVDPSLKHQLVTATWNWQPRTKSVQFFVPKESNQTVLFWLNEPGVKDHRWSMMISGDRTPVITVPSQPSRWGWVLSLVLAGGIVAWYLRHRYPHPGPLP